MKIVKNNLKKTISLNGKQINIKSDWQLLPLSEITIVKDGTHDSPKYKEKGIPFITSKNLKNGDIDFNNVKYISQKDHDKFFKRSDVSKNDLLFGMIGTIGSPTIVKTSTTFSIKNVALIKASPKHDQEFLRYQFLNSPIIRKQFDSLKAGGVLSFVKLSDIRNIKVLNIKKEEQEKIAKVLSQQEEQVNNIQKLIEKLEKRNQYYAERLLSGELRVREDEEGNIEFYENKDWKEIVNQKNSIKIPNGWDIKKLKDIGFVKTSSVNKVINDSEILVGLVNYMDVYRSKTKKIFNNLNYSETSCKSGQITENNLQKGDVLITPSSETREDIGHSTVVMEDFFNKVYSYHLVRFRFNEQSKIILDFKPYLFNSKYLRNQFERYAQGVTRMTLKKDSIERCFVKIPTKKEQLLISNFLNTIFKEKNEFELLLEKEQKRFEWLSDALLSGEYQIVD